MNKIPVGETIAKSYEFGFGSLLSVLGISWFPHLLLLLIGAGLVYLIAPDAPAAWIHGQFDPMQFLRIAPALRLLNLISFIVTCMVTVGIQNKALGRHEGPVFFYFSLGSAVWRLLLSWFLAILVIILVILLTAGAVALLWLGARSFAPNYALTVAVVGGIAAFLWIVYVVVRLTFFLPPVVVSEQGIGLVRAWELAGGNFWRIFIIAAAVILPTAILIDIVFWGIFGPILFSHIHQGMPPEELMNQFMRQFLSAGPYAVLFGVIANILFVGLGNAISAKSYLSVTADAEGKARTFA